MSVPTYTKTGTKATTAAKLPKEIFAVEKISHELLKQAYNTYLANKRTNNARTLKRGEVRGGGKKPWKQKGTGRARFGSIRVPIWRGGGITFGPTGLENYRHALPTSTKRSALRQALTVATQSNKITIIESFDNKAGKVAETVALLNKIEAVRNILLVVNDKDDMVTRATRNISNLTVVQAKYLNVFDILNADTIVLTTQSVEIISDWLGPKKAVK
ncbi:50S ribosomal protein L4 [Candidatus Saccharibacteria bacterium]|nr:50S ribosomal protein L4 [Candidatus Saccharibacteria bacterium]